MSAHQYALDVIREGRWWMVHIPELDGLTQARRLSEIETMAREWIALTRDLEVDDVTVFVSSLTVDDINVLSTREHISHLAQEAGRYEEKAASERQGAARSLVSRGVPVRDVAEILGVSFQRVSQLAKA